MSAPDLSTAKAALRARLLAARRALTLPERRRAAQAACAHLLALPELAAARTVAGYAATPTEIDPRPALEALVARGTAVLLPRVADRGLVLVAVADLDAVQPGTYGVAEPTGPPAAVVPEVVVVPGVAFDPAGRRLGRGGGHYDRLLAGLPAGCLRVGLAYALQVVEHVPTGPEDQPVDVVVTEEGVIRCR